MEVHHHPDHHFVLVHGSMHGAWQWYKLVDRLQKAGHKVTALDMAGAGIHSASPDSIVSYEEYNQPVTDFFRSLPEDDHQKVKSIGAHHLLQGEEDQVPGFKCLLSRFWCFGGWCRWCW